MGLKIHIVSNIHQNNSDIRTGSEITYVSLLYLNEKNQPQLLGEAHFAIAEL